MTTLESAPAETPTAVDPEEVAGRVVGTICLGLHDHASHLPDIQPAAEEALRRQLGRLSEEVRFQESRDESISANTELAFSSCSATRVEAVPP